MPIKHGGYIIHLSVHTGIILVKGSKGIGYRFFRSFTTKIVIFRDFRSPLWLPPLYDLQRT